jgi:hypothetical protein
MKKEKNVKSVDITKVIWSCFLLIAFVYFVGYAIGRAIGYL